MSRLAYAILDATLIPIDRLAHDQPYYSGKHKRHGLNVQVLADPSGELVWASPTLPDAAHDLTAARSHELLQALTEAQVMVFADKAYQGAGGTIRTPFKRHHQRPPLSQRQEEVNRDHIRVRGKGERVNQVGGGLTCLPVTNHQLVVVRRLKRAVSTRASATVTAIVPKIREPSQSR